MKPEDPAFPTQPFGQYIGHSGMSYREWLIGMCIQGFCSHVNYDPSYRADHAEAAICQADAIIAKLKEKP